jgi:hypothetical protein
VKRNSIGSDILIHISKASYCISKRNINSEYTCDCGKIFLTDDDLDTHALKCKRGLLTRLQQALCTISKQNDEIKNLKAKLVGNSNKLIPFPIDLSKEYISENAKKISPQLLCAGQTRLANFLVKHILTNENGELGVVCTSHTRKIFKYIDKDGNILIDPDAQTIINAFKKYSGPEIRKTLKQMYQQCSHENSDEDSDACEELMKPIVRSGNTETYNHSYEEYENIGNREFLNQLIRKTYKA